MAAMTAAGSDVEVAAAAVGLMSSVKGRRVSCATRGVVLEFDNDADADAAAGHHRPRLIESAVPVLLLLARYTDLYLITECDDDSTEEAVRSLLAARGLLAAGLNPHKALFCSTPLGRVHMARQLESHMHIDGNAAVAEGLHRHVARLGVVVAGAPPERQGGAEGVLWAATLSEMFGSRE
ncbi:Peroxin 22 (Pex22), putative [Acanthamoeba castellanii str. Neff]|uniref:Uncharacterized protein n=1 Tax=Acanthamoeba castellanii (strain ATCC 30010 / Neff) TaxID=1257118 RepID=L8HII9_ACACF|nr:Peroxin 22 (Pex22), putative [Acanthamoeba castellanii str. Neff]ELR25414.1 hypothetical protein ACA1_293850 [Acanthamoeba castellanii str. Neff]